MTEKIMEMSMVWVRFSQAVEGASDAIRRINEAFVFADPMRPRVVDVQCWLTELEVRWCLVYAKHPIIGMCLP